jgi:hypothetical protein
MDTTYLSHKAAELSGIDWQAFGGWVTAGGAILLAVITYWISRGVAAILSSISYYTGVTFVTKKTVGGLKWVAIAPFRKRKLSDLAKTIMDKLNGEAVESESYLIAGGVKVRLDITDSRPLSVYCGDKCVDKLLGSNLSTVFGVARERLKQIRADADAEQTRVAIALAGTHLIASRQRKTEMHPTASLPVTHTSANRVDACQGK